MDQNDARNHPDSGSRGSDRGPYDDDGLLAQDTPGLDPGSIRRDAGPDWPSDTDGDLEADTAGPEADRSGTTGG